MPIVLIGGPSDHHDADYIIAIPKSEYYFLVVNVLCLNHPLYLVKLNVL